MIFRWNKITLLLGGTAFIIIFLINLCVNLLWTAFYRGIIAFCIFFLIGIILTILFNYSFNKKTTKGTTIDIKSTNRDNLDLNEIYNVSNKDSFKPLKYTKLESSEKDI